MEERRTQRKGHPSLDSTWLSSRLPVASAKDRANDSAKRLTHSGGGLIKLDFLHAGFGYTTGHITMMRSTVVRKLLLDHSPAGIIKREMHACIITLVIYQTGLVVT